MRSRFVAPTDPEWTRTLETCPHDLYHLPGYARVEAAWTKSVPCAFLHEEAGESMLLPLLLRPTPAGGDQGFRDAVTPYGYSPPVFTSAAEASFRVRALRAYQEVATSEGIVSTFMRLHPLLLDQLPVSELGERWTQVEHGSTVDTPLPSPQGGADWLGGIKKGYRYDIRKLMEAGFTFELDTDDAWSAFTPIYRETMERVGAGDRYRYSSEYIQRFRSELRSFVHCGAVRAPTGELACAGLFTLVSGIMQYHLSGTLKPYQKRSPMKLLIAEMRKFAGEKGAQRLHLGGGVGADGDSLYAFKARFGGQRFTFRTVRVVHDPARFAVEMEAWTRRSGAEPGEAGGFFPPYRAPVELSA